KAGRETRFFSSDLKPYKEAFEMSPDYVWRDPYSVVSGYLDFDIPPQMKGTRMNKEPEERSAYLAELRLRAEQLHRDFQRLENQIAKSPGEAKARLANLKKTVSEKRAELMRRMDEATDRGEAAWDELKSGVEGAWNELKEATDRAESEVRD
ncbi:MAG: hypothetical protein PVJ76_21580, partial [Gemmatimonadota bacterium]